MTKAAVAAAAAASLAAAAAAADRRVAFFEGSKGREAKKVEEEQGSRMMRSVDSGSLKKKKMTTTTTTTKGEEKFAPRFDGLRFIETLRGRDCEPADEQLVYLPARRELVHLSAGDDVFSMSSRDKDDVEALKYAALEKLPTYSRVHNGIFFNEGIRKEIDIDSLGFQEKKKLLERLVRVTEEDNKRFLLKLKGRIDRVGIDFPTIEVWYEHLNIEALAYAKAEDRICKIEKNGPVL
uniref:Uncharacterized protein n=1 Tax=Ananas comosus var. bracteatus TaxID=296719 RepID=A0A6V7QMN7_ANACO|nr:unnamed protein product [Ananas comosus var. bracteatus]